MALHTLVLALALTMPGQHAQRPIYAYLRDDQRLGSSKQGLKYEGQLPVPEMPEPDMHYNRGAHRHLKHGNLGGNAKHYW